MTEQFDVSISLDRKPTQRKRGSDLQGQKRRNCDVQRNRRFHTSITRRLRFQRKELSCLDIGSEGTIILRLFSVPESLGKPRCRSPAGNPPRSTIPRGFHSAIEQNHSKLLNDFHVAETHSPHFLIDQNLFCSLFFS